MVNVAIEAALTLAVVGVSLTLVWLIGVLEEIKDVMRDIKDNMSDMKGSLFDAAAQLDSIDETMVKIDGGIYHGIGSRMQYWIDKDRKEAESNGEHH